MIGAVTLAFAALLAPTVARADTRTASVTLSSPLVTPTPQYMNEGGFGVYNFAVSDVTPDADFPFAAGQKFGHCVQLTEEPGSSPVTLRTAPDFTAPVALAPDQLQWLLESSRANSPLNALQAAAHQSAIWQITNPVPAAQLTDATGKATAAALLAQSVLFAADATKGATLDVVGGADTTSCAGTTRTLTVTGTPFTSATLTITSGVGTFSDSGTSTTTVAIGADGTGTATLQSSVSNPGAITVSATITVSTMVQSDGGGKQDFAYLEDQTETRVVTVTFTDCRLTVSKTAEPGFTRTFTWTVQKVVTSNPKVTVLGGGTATFNYAVTATKSAPVDTGWTVSGSISITNPGPATTATVSDAVPGATCSVAGGGASTSVPVASGGPTSVPYSCAFGTRPTYNVVQTNTASVSYALPNGTPIVSTASAPFTFADGTTGNPTVSGDSAAVTDTFNGGTPTSLGTVTQTTTFNTQTSVVVPASQTTCADLPNVATATSTGTPATATATVTTCTTTKVVPAGLPDSTSMSLTKTADVSVVAPSGLVRFTIHWKNTGKNAAKNVVVCDTLPTGMSFSSAAGSTFKSGKACWTRKSVGVGSELEFVVVAKVAADAGAQTFTNVATATASNAAAKRATAGVKSLAQRKARAGGVTG